MRGISQVFFGILAAVISTALVIGSLSMVMTEGGMVQSLISTPIPSKEQILPATIVATSIEGSPSERTPTKEIAYRREITITPTPLPSQTITPSTNCPPPAGWSLIVIQPGDTLASLANKYNVAPQELMRANCLLTSSLIPGTTLFVPGLPPTEPPIQCGPPSGWVFYTVRQGDTLYSLSNAYNVSVPQLQIANCMGSSTLIRVGQKLYVPNVPTNTPQASPTLKPTNTQPVLTPPADTNTPSPTLTPTPGLTNTPFPTNTPTSTEIFIPTDTLEPTEIDIPRMTPTPTDSAPVKNDNSYIFKGDSLLSVLVFRYGLGRIY
jgi:LysM repeat protein